MEQNQKELVHNTDWDFLVILDACRYDMFEEVYGEVFDKDYGALKKAISPDTWTMGWLNKIFPSFYEDIVYISGNPFVNSETRICHREHTQKIWYYLFRSTRGLMCYEGKKHFKKIVNVWNWGWDDKIGTVHPRMVNKGFHKAYLSNPGNRFVLHYMQPHWPYISLGGKKRPSHRDKVKSQDGMIWDRDVKKRIRKALNTVVPAVLNWKIKKSLGLPTISVVEKIYRKFGWKGIKEIYKKEILLDLKYVKMLTDSISANWVITSDHGERLGEKWKYGHGGKKDREIIEVPWFEIKGKKYEPSLHSGRETSSNC